jgi:hypothetical protein
MLHTKQLFGAVPPKYLPNAQLSHPFTPIKEQVVEQLASQLEAQFP